jgi:dTDP-glucose 4,6-dehydratase
LDPRVSGWLITGGAGFIGSHFVELVAERTADRIVVLDALTYAGLRLNLGELLESGRVELVEGDIRDGGLVGELYERHDFGRVAHFAAESHVDRSIAGPQAFLGTNVEGTYTLLQAARFAWRGQEADRLFVHVSTDEVFGDLGPDDPPFNESTPYSPSSPYAATKAASDHLAGAWWRTFGVPVVITNCTNNYGARQFPEKLIPLTVLNALASEPLPVYGDGLQVRDWLHVVDHCEALWSVCQGGSPGEAYLISRGEERANLDVVRLICRAVDELEGRPEGASAKLIRHVRDRAGHDRRYAMDSRRIRTELGWRPTRDLETELVALVRWYREHPEWVRVARSAYGELSDR